MALCEGCSPLSSVAPKYFHRRPGAEGPRPAIIDGLARFVRSRARGPPLALVPTEETRAGEGTRVHTQPRGRWESVVQLAGTRVLILEARLPAALADVTARQRGVPDTPRPSR